MSDIMYDDPDFKRDWRTIAVHDDKNVKGFFGDYRFLSNFYPASVEFEGVIYPSSENAYQAAKVAPNNRWQFTGCSAKVSKNLWKKVGTIYTPEQWDKVKNNVMRRVVFSKFLYDEGLTCLLRLTGDKYLEETLWWRDNYWGVDVTIGGENHLGKILMDTRAYFVKK